MHTRTPHTCYALRPQLCEWQDLIGKQHCTACIPMNTSDQNASVTLSRHCGRIFFAQNRPHPPPCQWFEVASTTPSCFSRMCLRHISSLSPLRSFSSLPPYTSNRPLWGHASTEDATPSVSEEKHISFRSRRDVGRESGKQEYLGTMSKKKKLSIRRRRLLQHCWYKVSLNTSLSTIWWVTVTIL